MGVIVGDLGECYAKHGDSPTDDGVCDDPLTMFGIPVDAVVIESGALAGRKLVRFEAAPNGSIEFGPIRISIGAPDAESILAIANRLEMVEPS